MRMGIEGMTRDCSAAEIGLEYGSVMGAIPFSIFDVGLVIYQEALGFGTC